MTSIFQPPPTYALPVIVDEITGKSVFNPIWLRWFLDLSKGLSASGTPGGIIYGPPTSISGHVVLWDNTTGTLLKDGGSLGSAAFTSSSSYLQVNPNFITFDITPTGVPTTTPGTLYWDSADGNQTLSLVMAGGATTLQVGEEQFYRIKASSAITDGQVVMFTGTVGASGALKGAPATGLLPNTAMYVMGVATENIALNGWGYVTAFGLVRGINTTGGAEAWVDGQILYYDPTVAGGLTKTVPVAPNPKVVVAAVVHAATNGSLFVRPAYGGKLGDFEGDVYINGTPRDLGLLQYNATNSRWESDSVAWLDIDFPILIRTAGAGIPTLTTLHGKLTMPQWAVNDFNVCESQEFIHSWKEGSTVYWHLHLTTNGLEAVNKYVRFELEYGYADVNGAWTFPAVVTTADFTIPANTPTKTMLILSLANFTPAIKIGAHAIARLKRVASAGAAPAADPWIPMLQMHVQLDTIGSRSIGTK